MWNLTIAFRRSVAMASWTVLHAGERDWIERVNAEAEETRR
jgi:hypothetical protein